MTYDPTTGCDLPDPWKAVAPSDMALAVGRYARIASVNVVAHMAAELLHLRRQRDDLQASNAALIERARKAEGRPETIDGGTCRVVNMPSGDIAITDEQGFVLLTGRYGKTAGAMARHLVNATADVAILRGRVEATAGDAKRLRHEVIAWRRASGCESPASLEATIADIRSVLASPIIYDATATKQFLAAMRGLKQRARSAEDALAAQSTEIDRLRGQANPAALAQAKDAEEKRAQWQHRAECGERRIAELAESKGTAAAERDHDLLMGSIRGLVSRIHMSTVLPENAIDATKLLTEVGDYYLAHRDRGDDAEDRVTQLTDDLAEYKHEFGPVRQAVEARASLLRGLSGAMKALRRPKVGLAVLVRRADGCLLMVRRKGAHGAGTWSFPGGHLEPGELPPVGAARELDEEAGIHGSVRMLGVWTYTDFGDDTGAYITLYAVVDVPEGTEFTNREPDKCHAGVWVPRGNPYPAPLFEPLARFLGSGVDPYMVQPGHPMLAAALAKLGVTDLARFVGAVKMGGAK